MSNQLQGRELFAWWSKLLGTETLFKQVDETSQRLYAALAEYETRQLTRAAFIGLPISIVLSFLSLLAAFLAPKDRFNWDYIPWMFGIGIGAVLLAMLAVTRMGMLDRHVWRDTFGKRDWP